MPAKSKPLPSLPTFSERLIWAMKQRNMSRSALARCAGMSPQAVGELFYSLDVYDGEGGTEMAKALCVPFDWLVKGLTTPEPPEPVPTPPAPADSPRDRIGLSLAGLSSLQIQALDTLVAVMYSGDFSDDETRTLLEILKPRAAAYRRAETRAIRRHKD
jgi:transcriptional regulator with XRE-family HTH domain